MAVDSAAAAAGGMNEPPPQKMDASPSELASGAPSPSASPLNALDRNGSADSSPYSRKGAEIEVLFSLLPLKCFLSLLSCQ